MTSRIARELPQEAQHRLIDIRYRSASRQKGRGKRTTPAALRVSELERIFTHRFGKLLPNNPEGREALQIFAEALCFTKGRVSERLIGYVNARAPWASAEAEAMAVAALSVARWQSADELAWRIGLSLVDRETLKIGTIGAVGLNKRQRTALQKAKKKHRDTLRRRAKGAKSRAEYERHSISRAKPWEGLGLSRATYYRRSKAQRETSPRHPLSIDRAERPLVSPNARCLRDALRAGPTGHGPDGPRWTEFADASVKYFGEESRTKMEARL
ncbi:hypothetical protein IVB16_27480 [Bradyrhizobium sp. 183]|uniref:hypothetical protein n=1 Tax=unclassified Bradyrhizobium TaxID=2631580 RepID=UPI001FFFBF69|nr:MULTISPECIES: hypothetical protein [unclassified Bradyrhizobium]UPJ78593.1 hypothetical protein IVB17_27480 [Bradyrhizobium sp. 184]UPJ86388.1 hypothetical protein IVB16_27480 [Bradyrhizobium sp. 183]